MSGHRCKALRRAFRAAHGRAPDSVEIAANASAGVLERRGARVRRVVSEWRRLKKAQLRGLLP